MVRSEGSERDDVKREGVKRDDVL